MDRSGGVAVGFMAKADWSVLRSMVGWRVMLTACT